MKLLATNTLWHSEMGKIVDRLTSNIFRREAARAISLRFKVFQHRLLLPVLTHPSIKRMLWTWFPVSWWLDSTIPLWICLRDIFNLLDVPCQNSRCCKIAASAPTAGGLHQWKTGLGRLIFPSSTTPFTTHPSRTFSVVSTSLPPILFSVAVVRVEWFRPIKMSILPRQAEAQKGLPDSIFYSVTSPI